MPKQHKSPFIFSISHLNHTPYIQKNKSGNFPILYVNSIKYFVSKKEPAKTGSRYTTYNSGCTAA